MGKGWAIGIDDPASLEIIETWLFGEELWLRVGMRGEGRQRRGTERGRNRRRGETDQY